MKTSGLATCRRKVIAVNLLVYSFLILGIYFTEDFSGGELTISTKRNYFMFIFYSNNLLNSQNLRRSLTDNSFDLRSLEK